MPRVLLKPVTQEVSGLKIEHLPFSTEIINLRRMPPDESTGRSPLICEIPGYPPITIEEDCFGEMPRKVMLVANHTNYDILETFDVDASGPHPYSFLNLIDRWGHKTTLPVDKLEPISHHAYEIGVCAV